MVAEFERYKLARFRFLTGLLQCLGAAGLCVGFVNQKIGFAAAIGLSLQMALGVGVRLQIKDPLLLALPAATYCLINAYIAWMFYLN